MINEIKKEGVMAALQDFDELFAKDDIELKNLLDRVRSEMSS